MGPPLPEEVRPSLLPPFFVIVSGVKVGPPIACLRSALPSSLEGASSFQVSPVPWMGFQVQPVDPLRGDQATTSRSIVDGEVGGYR